MLATRWALLILPGLAAGCGAGAEGRGTLPADGPPGPVVGLAVDSAGGRLLKAHPHAVFSSRDGGRSWAPVAVPAAATRGRIAAVAAPRTAPGALYLAGHGVGVVRSADGGRTWRQAGATLPGRDVGAFAAHATREGTLYAAVPGKGLFRTEDGGARWARMEAGPAPEVRHLFHSDMAGSMQTGWLFAAVPTKVRRSMDCFCGWRDTGALPGGAPGVYAVAYDTRRPAHVYASATAGVFHSADGGGTWALASAATPAKVALAFDPRSGALYGATADGTVLRSADEGRSWARAGG